MAGGEGASREDRPIPSYVRRPADPPLPRGRILAGTIAVVAFVVIMYNLTGQRIEEQVDAWGLAWCQYVTGSACAVVSENGFLASGVYMEIDLYWLPGIFSLIALPAFVFPTPFFRALIATTAAAGAVSAFWFLQVFGAIWLAGTFGWRWASYLTYGPVAVVLSYASFIAGFVVLLSLLLADSKSRQLEPRTLPGASPPDGQGSDQPLPAGVAEPTTDAARVVVDNSEVLGEDVGPDAPQSVGTVPDGISSSSGPGPAPSPPSGSGR